jgi:hypothetical protein
MKPSSVKSLIFVLFAVVLNLTGCAVTSSGNMVGEAASLRYSTAEKTYRFMEVGVTVAGTDHTIESPHKDMHVHGFTGNWKMSLYSLDYSVLGQKGGLFLSLPVSIPMDVGIRPVFVQWMGPFYLGAGASFVGGFYPNRQDSDLEPEPDNSLGRFDWFILYNLGGGVMFDVGEKFTFGAYMNYERMALNDGGSSEDDLEFMDINILSFHNDENMPAYAVHKNVTTLGVNIFVKMKSPVGFYAEYTPEDFLGNGGWQKFRFGVIALY